MTDDEVRARARLLMEATPGLCFQNAIRQVRAQLEGVPEGVPTSMAGAWVTAVTREQAQVIILRNEWLATMNRRGKAWYGLWFNILGVPTLAGVACFGPGPGSLAQNLCGVENRNKAISLERGACEHWVPKNAASWLIPKAVAMAAKDHGWRIFFAYSDPAAGEIGTVYQACNWHYLGVGNGRGGSTRVNRHKNWRHPETKKVMKSRQLRRPNQGGKYRADGALVHQDMRDRGYVCFWEYDKARYVWFEGSRSEKKKYRAALRYPIIDVKDYPKRLTLQGSD